MSKGYAAPPGTQDWLPERSALRRHVIGAATALFERAGYREWHVPLFEDIQLFARTSGESSDVVRKEMYDFVDKGGREVALRPEFTAGICRAYVEHGLRQRPQPLKVWSAGTVYRYNRMQRGRYREFTQFDAEVIGSSDPAADAELIALGVRWLEALGITGLEVLVNSLGDAESRAAYRPVLQGFLDAHRDELHPDVYGLRDVNPLRAFDTKHEASRAVMAEAPLLGDVLSASAREHLADVRAHLDARGIAYVLDPKLVRGLDYYTHTAWEVVWPALGAQSTVLGGGRYDGLIGEIGGEPTPGVGFAAGVDRIVLALEGQGLAEGIAPPRTDVFLACFERAARPRLHALLDEARLAGIACDADLAGRGVKGQLTQANRVGARVTVVVGDDEWTRGVAQLKDMTTGAQREVPLDGLVDALRAALEGGTT